MELIEYKGLPKNVVKSLDKEIKNIRNEKHIFDLYKKISTLEAHLNEWDLEIDPLLEKVSPLFYKVYPLIKKEKYIGENFKDNLRFIKKYKSKLENILDEEKIFSESKSRRIIVGLDNVGTFLNAFINLNPEKNISVEHYYFLSCADEEINSIMYELNSIKLTKENYKFIRKSFFYLFVIEKNIKKLDGYF